MGGSNRDDFSAKTKAVIAGRVNYICSNPGHRVFTMQAHSDPEKALGSGVAAHIRGAAPDGPRYDPSQPAVQRKHPRNGIWLCHSCSDLVDKDAARYTTEVLERWRDEQEAWITQQGGPSRLPEITIVTLEGLSQPLRGGRITGEDVALFREHRLKVKNADAGRLEAVRARIQLPERAWVMGVQRPAGVPIEISPERMTFEANVTGSGAVEFPDVTGLPTPSFTLSIGPLLPGDQIQVALISVPEESPFRPPLSLALSGSMSHYLEGQALYQRNQAFVSLPFVVPIEFDSTTRRLRSSPCEDDAGLRRRWHTEVSW